MLTLQTQREDDEEFRSLLKDFHDAKDNHYKRINEIFNGLIPGEEGEASMWVMKDINPNTTSTQLAVNKIAKIVNTLQVQVKELQNPGKRARSECTTILRHANDLPMPKFKQGKISLFCDEVL